MGMEPFEKREPPRGVKSQEKKRREVTKEFQGHDLERERERQREREREGERERENKKEKGAKSYKSRRTYTCMNRLKKEVS